MQIIDLYSGIGGFSLAGQWVGWRTIQFCEIDKWCHKILKKHWPKVPIHDDINTLTVEQVKKNILYNDKEETIITGGVPCQPASTAGKRLGDADDRWLWPQTIRFIGKFKPTYAVLENVAGLVSMDNGKTLDGILSDLENEGYTVESFIIPACGVGAWHRRDRIWIVAYNNTVRCNDGKLSGTKRDEPKYKSFDRDEGLDKDVSDTRLQRQEISKEQTTGVKQCSQDVSDPQGERCQQCEQPGPQELPTSERQILLCGSGDGHSGGWSTEPSVGRVVNGIPNRVDRLKGLGNAIVPQVVFEIFKVIDKIQNK